jgi:hypothetical protein
MAWLPTRAFKANALFKGYKTIKGGYYELIGDYVGIGSIYTIKADSWKLLNRRLFRLNSAIIQEVSGLCRYLEFITGRIRDPVGYGIIRGFKRNLTNVNNGFVFCKQVPIKIYFG